jgi:hypothetical protein
MDEMAPSPEEIIEVDGKRYRKVPTGYTIREYYSHSTDKGPGPGWDSRMSLADSDYSKRRFGRIFTEEQAMDPSLLPDEPMYRLEEIN